MKQKQHWCQANFWLINLNLAILIFENCRLFQHQDILIFHFFQQCVNLFFICHVRH